MPVRRLTAILATFVGQHAFAAESASIVSGADVVSMILSTLLIVAAILGVGL